MAADRDHSKRLNVKKMKEAFRLFFAFNGYVLQHWRLELSLVSLEVGALALSLLNPYLGKIILDNGVLGRNAALFLKVTFISVSVYLLREATDRASLWLKGYIARRVRVDLARRALKKTAALSLESFRDTSVSECVSRLNTDITLSSNIIGGTLPEIIKAALRLVLITAIIFFINWKILILILAYQAIAMAQANFFAERNEAILAASYAKSREMARVLTQVFSQIYLVKASGRMYSMMKRYFREFSDNMRLEVKSARSEFASGVLSELSSKLFFGIVGLAGTLLVIRGALSLGSLTAIIAYMSQGVGACSSLLSLCQRIISNRLPLERISELLDAPVYVKEKPGAREMGLSGRIEFKAASFGYSSGRRVLEKMSFVITPGGKIALVGASGCGKTTVVNLILRLYDVDEGNILLDGCDVREMKLRSIHGHIALAPQSPFVSGGSIRENITYGLDIGDAAVRRTAALAEIDSFIEGLPDGYDTVLSDMVTPLSQGQKQRIAIARSAARNPRILILDEACSSLDSKTEERIIENIETEFPKTTLITVTHRLSTVKKMEKVYFLKSCREMKVSTHNLLAEDDIEYNDLFAGQMSGPEYADAVK
jgi:ATP-binding cassette subfamily B protein